MDNKIELVKQTSERKNKYGVNWVDLYLVWTYENKHFKVRITPTFTQDLKRLLARATDLDNVDIG